MSACQWLNKLTNFALAQHSGAGHWTLVNEGLIDTLVHVLGLSETYIFAAGSSGSGAWRRSLSEMITSVENAADPLPSTFALLQNYPNPFNPATTISFSIPSRSFVSLKVLNLLGREVSTLVSEELPAGSYARQWAAAGLASGVYFYRLQTASFAQTKKLVLLR